MDMSSKEAFRLGFLTRCAEEGLTGVALTDRITTAGNMEEIALPWRFLVPAGAIAGIAGLLSHSGKATAQAAQGALQLPALAGRAALGLGGAAAGAGLLGGGALGYGAAKMTEPEISDDDIKQQELAETYRIYADRARAKRRTRKYRQSGL